MLSPMFPTLLQKTEHIDSQFLYALTPLLYLILIETWRETSVKKERIKVNYKPLWKMMIDKDISKGELRAKTGIAPSTFAKCPIMNM